jgi:isoleucyl-tRNA synthetase
MLGRLADEINVKEIVLITDDSELVERRVRPLLPRIGKKLGPAIPAVMAAARENAVEYHPDGSVTLGGVTLAADEVEILSTPRPGTAVAHDAGLVVVLDTTVTPELRVEGEARDLQRAIQELRREMGLAVDARVDLAIEDSPAAERIAPYVPGIAAETLADAAAVGPLPLDASVGEVEVEDGVLRFGIRQRTGAPS